VKLNSQFLKLELEDKRILYIAKDDICRIVFEPKNNRYGIFTRTPMEGMTIKNLEWVSEEVEPKAYSVIKTYLMITAG